MMIFNLYCSPQYHCIYIYIYIYIYFTVNCGNRAIRELPNFSGQFAYCQLSPGNTRIARKKWAIRELPNFHCRFLPKLPNSYIAYIYTIYPIVSGVFNCMYMYVCKETQNNMQYNIY